MGETGDSETAVGDQRDTPTERKRETYFPPFAQTSNGRDKFMCTQERKRKTSSLVQRRPKRKVSLFTLSGLKGTAKPHCSRHRLGRTKQNKTKQKENKLQKKFLKKKKVLEEKKKKFVREQIC